MRHLALAFLVVFATQPAFAQPAAAVAPAAQVTAAPAPTLAEQEQFLRTARIVKTKGAKKGVTATQRATMSDGTLTHDASIQTVDISAARHETTRGTELNFRDFWGYNVAAYRLGLMLGLDSIPPSVARRYNAKEASYTWWIDDVIMDEQARTDNKTSPPDSAYWRAQNDIIRVFDALIANTDRNQGNVLIDKRWKVWMIDHTRAFRLTEEPKNPQAIVRCERSLFAKLKTLDKASLKAELDAYLSSFEIDALLKRRDVIVARIESLGPSAFYELRRPAATTPQLNTK